MAKDKKTKATKKVVKKITKTTVKKTVKKVVKQTLKRPTKPAVYNPFPIEKKWQSNWEKSKVYKAAGKDKKFFALVEFPFPSGEGLHMGHLRSYTAMDIIARKRRMEGFNVLYPIGWDAFGLPAENYAIKTGIHPSMVTKKNSKNFEAQLRSLGFSFDWTRKVDTSDPTFYKWTQWIFLQMFKHGLAYQKETEVWWCEALGTVLANEEVIDGKSERGDHPCVRRPMSQWILAITKYAERLYKDLDDVNYLDKIKVQQRNWIGHSEGSEFSFKIKTKADGRIGAEEVTVFTTRIDTIYGVTYVVLAPEHKLVDRLKAQISNWPEVEAYRKKTSSKSELDRMGGEKDKTGVALKGVYAINPANGQEVPVWISDYVLASYGTGAVMAVPAHDERDYMFAERYELPVKEVISPARPEMTLPPGTQSYVDDGVLINSAEFNGATSEDARKAITKKVGGKLVVKHKLRDWIFSRQRYWGEPFPILWVSKEAYEKAASYKNSPVARLIPKEAAVRTIAGVTEYALPLPESALPLVLPNVKSFAPAGDGKSALGTATEWLHVAVNVKTGKTISTKDFAKLKKAAAKAKTGAAQKALADWYEAVRETDTMPNWAGSSWYYLRYADPKNKNALASMKALKYWSPVDWYNGGMEHTTLHLLYSRFWHKFLSDIKAVPTPEPYMKRTAQGMILGASGEKMSKSLGNVVNPDEIRKLYGADSTRVYEMFIGPFDQAVAWNEQGIIGSRRFLDRIWAFQYKLVKGSIAKINPAAEAVIHQTIKKVGEDIERMSFNTAISQLMILVNQLEKEAQISTEAYRILALLIAPFAPHIADELWTAVLREKGSVHKTAWPKFDAAKTEVDQVTIVVQVNGKVRAQFIAKRNESQSTLEATALAEEGVKKHLVGFTVRKVIIVPNRLVNIVVG